MFNAANSLTLRAGSAVSLVPSALPLPGMLVPTLTSVCCSSSYPPTDPACPFCPSPRRRLSLSGLLRIVSLSVHPSIYPSPSVFLRCSLVLPSSHLSLGRGHGPFLPKDSSPRRSTRAPHNGQQIPMYKRLETASSHPPPLFPPLVLPSPVRRSTAVPFSLSDCPLPRFCLLFRLVVQLGSPFLLRPALFLRLHFS